MAKKNKRGNDKIYITMTALVIAVFLFVGYKFGVQYLRYIELGKELVKEEQQLARVQEEYADLCEEKELLQTDTYIEYTARKNLGMIMEGEKLVLSAVENDAPTLNEDLNVIDYMH